MSTDADNPSDDPSIDTKPVDGDGVYPFAGLTRHDTGDGAMSLPENVWRDTSSMKYWAQNKVRHSFDQDEAVDRDLSPDVLPDRGLNTLINELPRATDIDVELVNPRTGERYRTLKSKAVVNPERLEQIEWGFGNHAEAAADMFGVDEDAVAADIQELYGSNTDDPVRKALSAHLSDEAVEAVMEVTTGDDALYCIPTSAYTIINPGQFLPSLCEVIQERELGDGVFGEIRIDRDTGRATLDVMFDGKEVDSPVFDDDREPVVVGLEVNWDFFGDWAVRACAQGIDWSCTNRISRITDREIVKHSGDVESRQDWFEWFDGIMDKLDEKVDQLSQIIEAASNETLDLSELPDDIAAEFEGRDAAPWTALYAYQGLPDYLAQHAGRRLQSQADDPYEPSWWEIHSAATYAVTHHDNSERQSGGSYEDHARVANDALFNPAVMEDRIVENYTADHEGGDGDLHAEGGAIAQIAGAFESVRDKRERYEEWEEELTEMGIDV